MHDVASGTAGGDSTAVARMAADDGAAGDGMSECIKGCNEKTDKVDEYLSCVKGCKAILGASGVFAGGGRIVIIG
jgi:hypothetical protein